MNDPQLPNAPVAATGELASFDLDSKKDKKKWKKKMKKAEEQQKRATVEKLDANHPRLDGKPSALPTAPPADAKDLPSPMKVQVWLMEASKSLDLQRMLTAQKSSFLIGINCIMLSIASHGLYSGPPEVGPLKWALIPLALTNVLSLTFAILSAQLGQPGTTLNQLFSVPSDQFDSGVAALLADKARAYASLSNDLHLDGVELSNRQRHLRTAYSVLLGGVAASALLFAVCLAVATRG